MIAFLSIPGIIAFINDPISSLTQMQDDDIISATSRWPLTFAVSLHVYHCIRKFSLKAEDIFHHLVFIPTLGIPGMIFDWGYFGNWLVFFICGFPGGVDYMLLALQKMNKCKNVNQKRISANLNMWMRLPGIIFGVGIAYKLFIENKYKAPTIFLIIQLIFMPINVIYYAKQSVISYTLFQVRQFVPTQNWNDLKNST